MDGHYKGSDITTFTDIFELLKEIDKHVQSTRENSRLNEPVFCYRGESKDYGDTKLTPSLFRGTEDVKKERHLYELLRDHNFMPSSSTMIEMAIESQHYLATSRMLDITFDVLTALYFACESQADEDANIYVFCFPNEYVYSPSSTYINDFYEGLTTVVRKPYYRNFKVFSHSFSNERIRAQKGGFIFAPGDIKMNIDNCYYRIFRISGASKSEFKFILNVMFGVNEARIYPEKEKIARAIKDKFDSNTYDDNIIDHVHDVHTTLRMIDYEFGLKSTISKEDHRLLRKEQSDLLLYIKKCKIKNEQEQFEFIKYEFGKLLMKYKIVRKGV